MSDVALSNLISGEHTDAQYFTIKLKSTFNGMNGFAPHPLPMQGLSKLVVIQFAHYSIIVPRTEVASILSSASTINIANLEKNITACCAARHLHRLVL